MTLEEISREINVSRTTIYKVLNNKGRVSSGTRKLVLEALDRYNYKPNLAAKNLAMNKEYNVAFVGYKSQESPYALNNLLKGIKWAENEFGDFGLRVNISLSNPEEKKNQIDSIQALKAEGADAFAIYPSMIEPMKECINGLVDSGFPVVTVNRDVPESKRIAYFGCDHYKSGILAAEVLARMIPPSKDLAVLLGGEGVEHYESEERYKGLLKKIERFPSVNLLPPVRLYDMNDGDAEKLMTAMIRDNENLGGILDLTSDLDKISRIVYGSNNKVRLVGFDLCDSVKNHMIRHSIDAVIFQDMPAQGYLAIKSLYLTLAKETEFPIPITRSKLEVVYEGNLDYYI